MDTLLLALFSILLQLAPSETPKPLEIRKGAPITVDGTLAPGEWDDAGKFELQAANDWIITVRYKHDGSNLLFAFGPVQKSGGRDAPVRMPEVLLDPANRKSTAWESGQWWLHASANDCEGNGEFNVYRRDGKFLCAKEKPGWQANNWPFADPPVVEMAVSFAKFGGRPDLQRRIGLALNLTDTQSLWVLWPGKAKLESPATWGEAIILP